ncbi:hypothetical protein F4802DRAFT_595298 [Xylaria palmicola]|nr:hypothetical protein F4802DRAFT_595298 [Xylaria palmicola]
MTSPNSSFNTDDCRCNSLLKPIARSSRARSTPKPKPNPFTNGPVATTPLNESIPALPSPSISTLSTPSQSPSSSPSPSLPPSRDPSELADTGAIEQVYQIVRDQSHGRRLSCRPYPTFHFTDRRAYALLLRRFEQEQLLKHFEELRADWDLEEATLTLRLMPTHIHEIVQDEFQQIDTIAHNYPTLQPLCKQLYSSGHADVKDIYGSKKSPDGQVLFDGVRHPLFIFEVAYSQRERALLDTITTYFSMFETCTVLTIDVEYAEIAERKFVGYSHRASVSLWTSIEEDDDIVIQHVIDRDIFRHGEQALPGELLIPFRFFLPWADRDLPNDVNLRFTFADLADMVAKAGARQRMEDATPPPLSFRSRKRKYRNPDGDEVEGLASSKRVAGSRSQSPDRPRRSSRLQAMV